MNRKPVQSQRYEVHHVISRSMGRKDETGKNSTFRWSNRARELPPHSNDRLQDFWTAGTGPIATLKLRDLKTAIDLRTKPLAR